MHVNLDMHRRDTVILPSYPTRAAYTANAHDSMCVTDFPETTSSCSLFYVPMCGSREQQIVLGRRDM